eukprot:gene13452-19310_t
MKSNTDAPGTQDTLGSNAALSQLQDLVPQLPYSQENAEIQPTEYVYQMPSSQEHIYHNAIHHTQFINSQSGMDCSFPNVNYHDGHDAGSVPGPTYFDLNHPAMDYSSYGVQPYPPYTDVAAAACSAGVGLFPSAPHDAMATFKPTHPSLLKPEHRNSKAMKRGPMDEMRQLVRILVKLVPKSMKFLVKSEEGGSGNRVSEKQIKEYLKGTLGEAAPKPEWGLPFGSGQYLAGRSWEAVTEEIEALGLFTNVWPAPLTKEGIQAALARRKAKLHAAAEDLKRGTPSARPPPAPGARASGAEADAVATLSLLGTPQAAKKRKSASLAGAPLSSPKISQPTASAPTSSPPVALKAASASGLMNLALAPNPRDAPGVPTLSAAHIRLAASHIPALKNSILGGPAAGASWPPAPQPVAPVHQPQNPSDMTELELWHIVLFYMQAAMKKSGSTPHEEMGDLLYTKDLVKQTISRSTATPIQQPAAMSLPPSPYSMPQPQAPSAHASYLLPFSQAAHSSQSLYAAMGSLPIGLSHAHQSGVLPTMTNFTLQNSLQNSLGRVQMHSPSPRATQANGSPAAEPLLLMAASNAPSSVNADQILSPSMVSAVIARGAANASNTGSPRGTAPLAQLVVSPEQLEPGSAAGGAPGGKRPSEADELSAAATLASIASQGEDDTEGSPPPETAGNGEGVSANKRVKTEAGVRREDGKGDEPATAYC